MIHSCGGYFAQWVKVVTPGGVLEHRQDQGIMIF